MSRANARCRRCNRDPEAHMSIMPEFQADKSAQSHPSISQQIRLSQSINQSIIIFLVLIRSSKSEPDSLPSSLDIVHQLREILILDALADQIVDGLRALIFALRRVFGKSILGYPAG